VEAHPIVLGCMATTDEQDPCVASASRVASVYHLAGGLGNFPVVGLRWGGGETTKHHPDADTLELPRPATATGPATTGGRGEGNERPKVRTLRL